MKTRRGERGESAGSKITAIVTSPAAREERGVQEMLPSTPTPAVQPTQGTTSGMAEPHRPPAPSAPSPAPPAQASPSAEPSESLT